MLHKPGAVEAESVCQLDLFQGLREDALLIAVRPRTRHLVLEEQPELHRKPGPGTRANLTSQTVELCAVGALRPKTRVYRDQKEYPWPARCDSAAMRRGG